MLEKILGNTTIIAVGCLIFIFVALGVNHSLYDYMKVKRVERAMNYEISSIEVKSASLKKKLEYVNDPEYIEKSIKDRFDLAQDGDLVFIFSEETRP